MLHAERAKVSGSLMAVDGRHLRVIIRAIVAKATKAHIRRNRVQIREPLSSNTAADAVPRVSTIHRAHLTNQLRVKSIDVH